MYTGSDYETPKDDKFRVIYNDGSYGELEAQELVIALNRTYEQIGMAIDAELGANAEE